MRVACRILGVRGYLLVVPYSLPGGGGLRLLWWEASPRSGVEGGVGLCTLKHMGNLSRCDLLVSGGGALVVLMMMICGGITVGTPSEVLCSSALWWLSFGLFYPIGEGGGVSQL